MFLKAALRLPPLPGQDQFGHAKPSMTMDHYMSRRAVTERAALVL
jgi:hypothetical protein